MRRGRRWRDVHNSVGLYAALALAASASTAALLSIPSTRGLGAAPAQLVTASAKLETNDRPCESLDAVARTAARATPNLALYGVYNLAAADQPFAVLMGRSTSGGYRWVAIDRETCRVLSIGTAKSGVATKDDASLLINLHQGHFFGKIGQLILAVASVVPIILYVTGLTLWIRRTRRSPASA